MESQPEKYEPGIDQNQGIVGEMARAEQNGPFDPMEEGASQSSQFDPNTVTNAETAEELGADAADNDMMDEEAVEDGDVTITGTGEVDGTDEEQASFDGPDF